MIRLEWTAADVPGALDALTKAGITLYDTDALDDVTVRFGIQRQELAAVERLCEKRGDALRVLGRDGLYWQLRRLKKRPVLVLGIAVLICLTLLLPTRVFFVQVEGNNKLPVNRILEAAGESGICFGATRREVRSERMKNALLGELPELQWAGVNTRGCVAVITVREKPPEEKREEVPQVSSIVASTDGIILSATVTGGNLVCTPGQAVTQGQVLISGFTDCGIAIRATRAEGEVVAQTRHDLTVVTPAATSNRGAIREEAANYSLLVGKNRINLWKGSGIWEGSCGRMYEEYYITLPGGFRLPVALVKEVYTAYDTGDGNGDSQESEMLLSGFAEAILRERMLAGTILDRETDFRQYGDGFFLKGSYLCTEMIGRERIEQMGDTNEQSD